MRTSILTTVTAGLAISLGGGASAQVYDADGRYSTGEARTAPGLGQPDNHAFPQTHIITFDDLGATYTTIPSGYQGFEWSFRFGTTSTTNGGYGMLPGWKANNKSNEPVIWMTSLEGLVDITQLDFVSAWRTWNTWELEGLRDNQVIHSKEVTVTPNQAETITLNFTQIDTLRFRHLRDSGQNQGSGSGIHIAMKNIHVEDDPSLNIRVSGACPGTVTVEWRNATPGRTAGLLFAANQGSFTITTGPCAGTQLGLGTQQLQLVRQFNTGSQGEGQMSGLAGVGACGRFLQVVVADGSPCDTSNVGQIP